MINILIFLILVLPYFLISGYIFSIYSKSKDDRLFIGLYLSRKQVLALIVLESAIYGTLRHYSTDEAQQFMWNVHFVFMKGILPVVSLGDRYIKNLENIPDFLILFCNFFVDYLFFWIFTFTRKMSNGFFSQEND